MSKNPPWVAAVFDLDGTLCDTIALIVTSFRHAHREVLDIDLDEAEARAWIGRTLPDIYAPHGELAPVLRESYVRFNLANLERLQTRFEGIDRLLDDLEEAGVRLGVATSKHRAAAERSLAAAGLTHRVPLLASLDDTARHKPHPDPLVHAFEALGVEPGKGVYVGDAVVDIQAAKAAGCDQIAVTWGAGDRTELMLADPTAVCDEVDELARWLLG